MILAGLIGYNAEAASTFVNVSISGWLTGNATSPGLSAGDVNISGRLIVTNLTADEIFAELSCGYITGNTSDLCAIVDTDTHRGNTTAEILAVTNNTAQWNASVLTANDIIPDDITVNSTRSINTTVGFKQISDNKICLDGDTCNQYMLYNSTSSCTEVHNLVTGSTILLC